VYNCNSLEWQDNGSDRMDVSHGRVKGNDGDRFGTTQIDRLQLFCYADASNIGMVFSFSVFMDWDELMI